jgi:hypothetical protein
VPRRDILHSTTTELNSVLKKNNDSPIIVFKIFPPKREGGHARIMKCPPKTFVALPRVGLCYDQYVTITAMADDAARPLSLLLDLQFAVVNRPPAGAVVKSAMECESLFLGRQRGDVVPQRRRYCNSFRTGTKPKRYRTTRKKRTSFNRFLHSFEFRAFRIAMVIVMSVWLTGAVAHEAISQYEAIKVQVVHAAKPPSSP